MKYNFTQPFLKQNTKKVHVITDCNNELVGGIQRFYKNKIQFLIDFFIDGFFLNFKVYDQNNKVRLQAQQNLTYLKDTWDIYEDGNLFKLKCITKIKTNPRYVLHYNKRDLLIYRDFLDKFIRIKDTKTDTLISEFEYKTLLPPRQVSITINDSSVSIYLVICLYLVLSTKYN